MNTSCSCAHNDYPGKYTCPVNGRVYASVNRRTVLHHVKSPWTRQIPEQGYYFCTDPDCEVVYFGEDDFTLLRNEMRMPVGQKSHDPERPICYCFDIRATDATAEEGRTARQFVIDHTRDASCDCEIRNPSDPVLPEGFPRAVIPADMHDARSTIPTQQSRVTLPWKPINFSKP